MNDDSFGDSLEGQLDEPLNGESECNNEPDQTELHDDGFKLKNAFIQGGAMGFGYGEGLRERKRRKWKILALIQDPNQVMIEPVQ